MVKLAGEFFIFQAKTTAGYRAITRVYKKKGGRVSYFNMVLCYNPFPGS